MDLVHMDLVFCEFCGAEYNRRWPDQRHSCNPQELREMAAEAAATGDKEAAESLRQWIRQLAKATSSNER